MDITRAYGAFVRALESGSFSAVAREMGISQSAVSKNIAALEANIGVQLFNRTTRKLHPTDEALQLYEHVRHLLDSLESLKSRGALTTAGPRGILRLTAPNSYGRHRVLPLVPRFLEKFPNVKLDLVLTDDVLDLIEDGLELGIRIGNLPSNTVIARSIDIVQHTLVASPKYLAKNGRPESPTDLTAHRCIIYGPLVRWDFESEHGRQSVEISGPLRLNDSDAILSAVSSGLGIGLIPDWIDRGRLENLEMLLPDFYPIPQPVSFVYPQTRFVSLRTRSFIDFLAGELRRG